MVQVENSVTKIAVLLLASGRDFQSEMLADLLGSDPAFHLSAHWSIDAQGWGQVASVDPNIVLLRNSYATPRLLEQIRAFRRDFPMQKLVVLSEPLSEEYLTLCIKAGLAGFITTRCSKNELFKCLHTVADGQIWIHRNILEDIARDFHLTDLVVADKVQGRLEGIAEVLTTREREVFLKVIEGLSTKEIADSVHLSDQGVKLHLGRIFLKFGVSNRTQLVLEAFKKLFPVDDIHLLFHAAISSPPKLEA